MEVKKVSEYKGMLQLGRCVECGEFETDFHRLYRLQFNGTSICLCPACFRKIRAMMNDVILDGDIDKTRSMEEKRNCRLVGGKNNVNT